MSYSLFGFTPCNSISLILNRANQISGKKVKDFLEIPPRHLQPERGLYSRVVIMTATAVRDHAIAT